MVQWYATRRLQAKTENLPSVHQPGHAHSGKVLRQTSYKHTSKEAADRRLPKPSGSMPASATWLAPYVVTEPSSQINHFSPIWRLLLLFCYGMS